METDQLRHQGGETESWLNHDPSYESIAAYLEALVSFVNANNALYRGSKILVLTDQTDLTADTVREINSHIRILISHEVDVIQPAEPNETHALFSPEVRRLIEENADRLNQVIILSNDMRMAKQDGKRLYALTTTSAKVFQKQGWKNHGPVKALDLDEKFLSGEYENLPPEVLAYNSHGRNPMLFTNG